MTLTQDSAILIQRARLGDAQVKHYLKETYQLDQWSVFQVAALNKHYEGIHFSELDSSSVEIIPASIQLPTSLTGLVSSFLVLRSELGDVQISGCPLFRFTLQGGQKWLARQCNNGRWDPLFNERTLCAYEELPEVAGKDSIIVRNTTGNKVSL